MAKNRPTTGATNWGDTLNAHLNQFMPTGGGINFGTTRPSALTASDDGYTMVDTTTRELIRWTGTSWEVLLGGSGVGRLTQDLNLYVRTDGNDGNDGRTNTASGAFSTIQKAVDVASLIDSNPFAININVADGTYDGVVASHAPIINNYGYNNIVNINGNSTNPSNVIITRNKTFNIPSGLNKYGFYSSGIGVYNLNNLTFHRDSTEPGHCVSSDNGIVNCNNVKFTSIAQAATGLNGSACIVVGLNGFVRVTGTTDISGTWRYFGWAFANGLFNMTDSLHFNNTIITETLAADMHGIIDGFTIDTISGTSTGRRFDSNANSVIRSKNGNSGIDFYPGTIAGVEANGGIYY